MNSQIALRSIGLNSLNSQMFSGWSFNLFTGSNVNFDL